MTPLAVSLIAAGAQSGLIVLLAADKWVHRLTGPSSLESRIAQLEKRIEEGNARSSRKSTELTVYLDERRRVTDNLGERIAMIEGELRGMRNQRADGSLIDERRRGLDRRGGD